MFSGITGLSFGPKKVPITCARVVDCIEGIFWICWKNWNFTGLISSAKAELKTSLRFGEEERYSDNSGYDWTEFLFQ